MQHESLALSVGKGEHRVVSGFPADALVPPDGPCPAHDRPVQPQARLLGTPQLAPRVLKGSERGLHDFFGRGGVTAQQEHDLPYQGRTVLIRAQQPGELVPGELAAERLERGVKLGLPVLLLTHRHPPATPRAVLPGTLPLRGSPWPASAR